LMTKASTPVEAFAFLAFMRYGNAHEVSPPFQE
jgi:hypothetical protein